MKKTLRDYHLGMKVYVVRDYGISIEPYEIQEAELINNRKEIKSTISKIGSHGLIDMVFEVSTGVICSSGSLYASFDIKDCKKTTLANTEEAKTLIEDKILQLGDKITRLNHTIADLKQSL